MSAAAVLSECWYTMVDLGQSLFTVTCSHWVNSGPGTAGCRPFIILPAFVFARQRGWHQVETACFPQPRCPSNSNLDLFTSPSPPEWHFMAAYVYKNIRCVCGTGDELPLCVCVCHAAPTGHSCVITHRRRVVLLSFVQQISLAQRRPVTVVTIKTWSCGQHEADTENHGGVYSSSLSVFCWCCRRAPQHLWSGISGSYHFQVLVPKRWPLNNTLFTMYKIVLYVILGPDVMLYFVNGWENDMGPEMNSDLITVL